MTGGHDVAKVVEATNEARIVVCRCGWVSAPCRLTAESRPTRATGGGR